MKKGLLIWMTMLALAFVMSFATVLSFADTPAGDAVVTDNQVATDEPAAVDSPAVTDDQGDVVLFDVNNAEKTDLAACTITWPKTVNYNDSNPINAAVTVKLPGGDVVPASEYSVLVDPPEVTKSAEITIFANEDSTLITGTASSTVAVVYPMSKYAKITLSKTSIPLKYVYDEDYNVVTKVQKPTVKVTNTATGETLKESDYTVVYTNKNSRNAGTYYVSVKAKSGSNYTGQTNKYKYKITPKKLNTTEFSARAASKYYTGKKIKPKKVFVEYYDKKTEAYMDLVKGKHYTVSKKATFSNNKNVGLAKIKITIKGKGNFTGTKTITGVFFISPEKAKIKSVKAGKKKITVKWKKSKHADGYFIDCSGKNSNGQESYKFIDVKSKNTVAKTIKNLKSGYTYEVRVLSYKKMKNAKPSKWYNWTNSCKKVKVK